MCTYVGMNNILTNKQNSNDVKIALYKTIKP